MRARRRASGDVVEYKDSASGQRFSNSLPGPERRILTTSARADRVRSRPDLSSFVASVSFTMAAARSSVEIHNCTHHLQVHSNQKYARRA